MKLPLPAPKKIAIFRALHLGDLLCSVPAFRGLRNAFPQAKITLISLPWAESFAERFSGYIDNFLPFPGYPGLPEQEIHPSEILFFLKEMQDEQFDLVLQMQGNGTFVNPMISLFNAGLMAGYFLEKDYCPMPDLFVPYPEKGHEIHRQLELLKFLEIGNLSDDLEFPLSDQDEEELRKARLGIPERYICIHPGSKAAWRQWSPENFALMAEFFNSRGCPVIFTGNGEEIELARHINQKLHTPAIIVCGKTSLGAMAVLLKNSMGLLSNCTGVSHLAAALKVPSVVISMDGDAERWAPLDHKLHTTIDWTVSPEIDLVLEACMQMLQRTTYKSRSGLDVSS